MLRTPPHRLLPLLLATSLGLTACGGGGGGGGGTPANQSPTANAGADKSVVEGSAVTQTGSGSDPDGSIAGYAWTQVGGPAVSLANANTATVGFTAPQVTANTAVTLRLTVTDNRGATASDEVVITVNDSAPPPNQAPTANAGADQTVAEGATVSLAGSGSDADGTITGYAWTQVSGPAVTLSNANSATAGFTAPQVDAATALAFRLTVTDNGGLTASDEVVVTVNDGAPPPASVTVSGKITFDYVPHNPSTSGLNYAATSQRPVRGALVEAIDPNTQAVLASGTTDASGDYSVSLPSNTQAQIRVKALMKKTGTPSWDFQVVDNTNGKALYTLAGASFDTGAANSVRNLNAASGWGGTGYTGTRAAGPFAILDSVYQAYTKVLSADANAQFPALKLNWSINNRPEDGEPSTGAIGTSYYSNGEIYILGASNVDTDEYDGHVVIHEWGHYFEDNFSRSDSIGGNHGSGDRLDMRVAFGEGWGNAWSGIATDNPIYHDSYGVRQSQRRVRIDVDDNSVSNPGWFSEGSVQAVLYDLYDSGNDGGVDQLGLGYGPIHAVMTGAQKTTPAFTSIFSFTSALKSANPVQAAGIDMLIGDQGIDSVIDIYGTGETHAGGALSNVLPVYTTLVAGAPAVNLCSLNEFGEYNKLSNNRFLRFAIATPGSYTLRATPGPNDDPDMFLYHQGQEIKGTDVGNDGEDGQVENLTANLAAGDYVAELQEYANGRGQLSSNPPPSKRACFQVQLIKN